MLEDASVTLAYVRTGSDSHVHARPSRVPRLTAEALP